MYHDKQCSPNTPQKCIFEMSLMMKVLVYVTCKAWHNTTSVLNHTLKIRSLLQTDVIAQLL